MKRLAVSILIIGVVIAVVMLVQKAGFFKRSESIPDQTVQTAPTPAPTPGLQGAVAPTGEPSPAVTPGNTAPVDLSVDALGLSKATVVMKTSKGTIKFKFYSKDAPNHVNRLVQLIQSKFYNGLTFHRVVPGFVVQVGDPKSRLRNEAALGGGTGVTLKLELNGRKHVRGTVAMARANDPNSADSQFYITLGNYPHLDTAYTVFGQVVDYGEKVGDKDVLDRISQWDEVIDMHIE